MSYASTITGVPVGFNKILPTATWVNSDNPLFVPVNGVLPSLTTSELNVSTINGYSQNNWWNLQTFNSGVVNNLVFGAISSGSGLVEAPGSIPQSVCKGGQSYLMNIPYTFTTNAQANYVDFITPFIGFSTGTLTLAGGSFYGDSNLTHTHYGAFNGVLDCPVDNAPLVAYGRTDTLVVQSDLATQGTNTFVYGKIANTTN